MDDNPRMAAIMPRGAGHCNKPRPCTRAVTDPEGVRYESVTQAAQALGRPLTTVHGWLRSPRTGWLYADAGIASPTAEG